MLARSILPSLSLSLSPSLPPSLSLSLLGDLYVSALHNARLHEHVGELLVDHLRARFVCQ
jgi:hypothetical protein